MPNAESFSPFSVVSNDFVDAVSAGFSSESEATSVVVEVVLVSFVVFVAVVVVVVVVVVFAVEVAAVVESLVFVLPHPVSATHESSKSNVPAVSDTAARGEFFSEKLNLDPQEVLKSRLHKT